MRQIKGKNGGTLCVLEKGETKNPNGRPRMIFSQLAKAWKDKGVERATPARVIEMYEYLLGLTIEEINEIAQNGEDGKDNGYPAFIRLAAVEMMGENRIKILQEMLDRAHGKAMQKTQLDLPEKSETKEVVFHIQYRDPNENE